MAKGKQYSSEVRERAVRLVFDHAGDYDSQWAAIQSIAQKFGCSAETLLSKSDFKAASACPANLYYRKSGYPSAKGDDPFLMLLAEGGYMVEKLVKAQHPGGITIDPSPGHAAAAGETLRLLHEHDRITLFEATFIDAGRLARVDILRKEGSRVDLLEVKSGTFDRVDAQKRFDRTGSYFRSLRAPHGFQGEWLEYLEDVTYQHAIVRDVLPGLEIRPFLVLVDGEARCWTDGLPLQFRFSRADDGRLLDVEFLGDAEAARANPMTVTIDVASEVAEREPEVRERSRIFLESLGPPLTRLGPELARHCADCEFVDAGPDGTSGFEECWGPRAARRPLVLELSHGRELIDRLIEEGVDSLLQVPLERLGTGARADRQRIQIEHTIAGTEWIGSDLRTTLEGATYPLHFLDFEAGRLAVPHFAGMRPYGMLAFQWSCHTLEAPGGALIHREWLNTDEPWPSRACATSLRELLGEHGTVLTWSHYESDVMNAVADDLDQLDSSLSGWLRSVALRVHEGGRVLDLHQVCEKHYFHPLMGRRTGIKYVLDAIWRSSPETRRRFEELTGLAGDPELGPYAALPPILIGGDEQIVAEGTGAIRAYGAMMYGAADPAHREAWRRLLLQYCELDTLAMVLVWEHWMRGVSV